MSSDGKTILGTSGGDSLEETDGNDLIAPGSGNDTVGGGDGDDVFLDGAGDDVYTGGAGAVTFLFSCHGSGTGNDTITDFTSGEDTIDLRGFPGVSGFDDLTLTQGGDDVVIDLTAHGGGTVRQESVSLDGIAGESFIFQADGTEGEDSIQGLAFREYIHRGGGDDTLDGGGGDDVLFGGGAGVDELYGGSGSNTFDGGAGDDYLVSSWSKGDADTFVFAAGDGHDTIIGLADGADRIDLTQTEGIEEFEDLIHSADGSDVLVDLAEHGGGSVRLTGVKLDDLDATDFHFHTPDPTDTDIM